MHQHLVLLLNCPVVMAVTFVSGIGGSFNFGYSLSVMTAPSAYIKELMNRTCVHRYNVSLEQWHISLIWSFMVSVFCIGGLVGALSSGQLLAKFGRKKCLILNDFVAICGAALLITSQTATSYEMILLGRFLHGISAGVILPAHTMYISECAPKRLKAMVGVTVGTFMAFGKFFGQLMGISELLGTEKNWPWLLGFNGFTALFQLLTLPFLPESPSFLLMDRGDRPACEKALKRLWGDRDYSREVEEMLEEKAALQGVRIHSVLELVQSRAVRWQLVSIAVLFTSTQFCGVPAVYFYSFEVFRAAGIPELKLPYAAFGMGLCEVLTSVVCFLIVGNLGGKVLLVGGYLSMAATLALLTITLYLQSYVSWMPYCSMVLVFYLIFSFSCGPAGVTPLLPGQMFTQAFKPAAYTLATSLSWLLLFVLGMIFPVLVENLGYCCFVIFLLFCLGSGLFVKFCVPEMKNRTVLEVTAEFEKMHSKPGESQRGTSTEWTHNAKTSETKF